MILLSFDIEEFDLPSEHGHVLSFDDQIKISSEGTVNILNLLLRHHVKATFYVTAEFARNAPDIIKRITDEGHEVASHGFYHGSFKPEDLKSSADLLYSLVGKPVKGFRMARMMPVEETEIHKAGYIYNSSINPIFLPGRYNNLNEPRTYFKRNGVWQLPASTTPIFRFPLFWLSFHNLPLFLYRFLVKWTCKKDGYFNVYFHPWEFMPIGPKSKYNIPFYITKNTGQKMIDRLDTFIVWAKKNKFSFGRTDEFIDSIEVNELD